MTRTIWRYHSKIIGWVRVSELMNYERKTNK